MWLKYRRGTSSSAGTWQYKFLGNNNPGGFNVEGFIEDLNNEYRWSEHHRGYEYYLCWFPPEDVLKRQLDGIKFEIKRLKNRAKIFSEQLKTLKD